MGQNEQPEADGDRRATGSATSNAPDWQSCGLHRFYLREDVLFWECHGPMQLQDLVVMFDNRMALQRQHGRVFLLFDAHGIDSIPAESRKYAVQFKPDPPIHGAVVVLGAGLLIRAAVSLILGAARLLGRRDLRTVFFSDDEAEAWATLEHERIALGTAP